MATDDAAASDELDRVIERFRRAQEIFIRGDPEPTKLLFSARDDVTLANPLGPVRRGPTEVHDAMEQAAALLRDGGDVRYEEVSRYVTPEFAYIVHYERTEAKVGGRDEVSPVSLRVTMIFRREDDAWKIVHRHADPITAPRAADSIIDK